jgi:hypothetical protein
MVSTDNNGWMAGSSRRDPSDEMTMGMVHVDEIELFLPKIVGEVQNIPEVLPKKRGGINF